MSRVLSGALGAGYAVQHGRARAHEASGRTFFDYLPFSLRLIRPDEFGGAVNFRRRQHRTDSDPVDSELLESHVFSADRPINSPKCGDLIICTSASLDPLRYNFIECPLHEIIRIDQLNSIKKCDDTFTSDDFREEFVKERC